MLSNKVIILLNLSFIFSESLYQSSEIYETLYSEEGWKKIEVVDDSIEVSAKYIQNISSNAYKVALKTSLSLNKIQDLLFDVQNYNNVLDNTRNMQTNTISQSKNSKIVHQVIESNISFVDSREYIFEIVKGSFDPKTDKVLVHWNVLSNVENDYDHILDRRNILIKNGAGIWKYKKINNSYNLLEYILYLDPGGYIPKIFIDVINKESIISLFRDVIKNVKNKS